MCNRKCSCNSQSKEVEIFIELCHDEAKIPKYSHPYDAGLDVVAVEDVLIHPQQTVIIKTGLKVSVPEGYSLDIRARSGVSLNTPLRVSNGIGTVDNAYLDEVGVLLTNTSLRNEELTPIFLNSKGNKQGIYLIRKGDKICQFVLNEVPRIKFLECTNVKDQSLSDRNGGFGSTGINTSKMEE